MRYDHDFDYSPQHAFGQRTTAMYPKKKAPNKKIDSQSVGGVFVGYDDPDGTKTYRVYILATETIAISNDCTFLDISAKERPNGSTTPRCVPTC